MTYHLGHKESMGYKPLLTPLANSEASSSRWNRLQAEQCAAVWLSWLVRQRRVVTFVWLELPDNLPTVRVAPPTDRGRCILHPTIIETVTYLSPTRRARQDENLFWARGGRVYPIIHAGGLGLYLKGTWQSIWWRPEPRSESSS